MITKEIEHEMYIVFSKMFEEYTIKLTIDKSYMGIVIKESENIWFFEFGKECVIINLKIVRFEIEKCYGEQELRDIIKFMMLKYFKKEKIMFV